MNIKTIIFDLDGTLTDSGEGIINCAIVTLEHFGLPVPDRNTLRVFVGPPLRDSFLRFGVLPEQIDEAIRVYRARYTTIGKFENFPYPGMESLLQRLRREGHTLCVATSKPEHMAVEILEKFGLAPYFHHICGAALDGLRDSKADVIAYLLEKLESKEHPIMVGDTAFDVTGAAVHQIPTIGVSWGYGDASEMISAGAIGIVETMEDLYERISRN